MPKRNPLARELRLNPLYRARRGKTRHQAKQRADRWSRAAKHKPPKGLNRAGNPGGCFVCLSSPAPALSFDREV